MYIITVIPLARGIAKETLSYYTKEWLPVGVAITVQIRNKEIPGIVASCVSAREQKAAIKSATFSLKRIVDPKPRRIVLDEFIDAANVVATLHASTTGAVLHSVLPLSVIEASTYEAPPRIQERTTAGPEPRLLHAPFFDRPLLFRRLVREILATNSSCVLIAPTITRAKALHAILERGIEQDTFLLHSDLSGTNILRAWDAALISTRPILAVVTPGFLALPRANLGAIILEAESDSTYIRRERPFLHIRTFVEEYARALGISLHIADNLFKVETYHAYSKGIYDISLPFSLRTTGLSAEELIDMTDETSFVLKKTINPKLLSIPLVSTKLVTRLSINQTTERKTFLFVGRKGLAPQTICGDCGTPIACTSCGLPALLHETKEGRIYACHHCQKRLPAETTCHTCRGWRLIPLGIGCDTVRNEIAELFPDTPIIQIDALHCTTKTQALRAYQTFKESRSGILLGTEMALRAIDEPVESVAVVSIDNRFSVPDYRIHEHLYRTLVALRERSIDPLIIQTRHLRHPLFHFFIKKSYADFYEHEIAERRTFGYPPFVSLIRLTITGTPQTIQKKVEQIEDDLAQYELVQYEALRPTKKGERVLHILIKVPTTSWYNLAHDIQEDGDESYRQLLTYLRALSPSIAVEYEPKEII